MSKRNTDFTQSIEDDALLDGPLISQNALDSDIKKSLKTSHIMGSHCTDCDACGIREHVRALAAVCWLTDTHSAECNAALNGVDSKTLVILLKVGLWLLVFLFERCVQYHHSAVRQRGYLQFYRKTAKFKHLLLLIHSAGHSAVLIVLALSSVLDGLVKNLSVYLLLVIISVELLASIICLLMYTVHVLGFNRQSRCPDVMEDEKSHALSGTSSDAHAEMGFRDGSYLEEVVEKQADLIEYLKQHNTLLSKRILTLTSHQFTN